MVRSILTNRFYAGEFIYYKTEPVSVGSRHKRHLPKSEWVTMPNHHDPVISDDLFEKAKCTQTCRSTKRKHPKHPLTGKLYCGGCGFSMFYKKHTKAVLDNNLYYIVSEMPTAVDIFEAKSTTNYQAVAKDKVCNNFECRKHSQLQIPTCCIYYRADVLEELILTLLNKELLKMIDLKESKEALKAVLKKRMDTLNDRIRNVVRQMEELEDEKSKVYEDYAEGLLEVEGYKQAGSQYVRSDD